MKILRGICRILFAATFIFSGLLKLIDPVGTGLIVQEYLSFLHLTFLNSAATGLGIALSALEFTVGISVLLGLKIRITSAVALVMAAAFTVVTIVLVIFNPIEDCGCFGEAIKMTNGQSLIKNIILLALAIIIFSGRKKIIRFSAEWLQWCFIAIFFGYAIFSAVYLTIFNPRIEFTAYRVGTDLNDIQEEEQASFETLFIYEKDGMQQEFSLSNLPDSSWTFVDSRTELIEGNLDMAQIDFRPHTFEGQYFAVSEYDPEKIPAHIREDILEFKKKCVSYGVNMEIYTPGYNANGYAADRKSLMTLNRSNGGVTFFSDGVIVKKWAAASIDRIDISGIAGEDPDVTMIKERIHQQIYVSCIVIGIIVLMLMLNLFSRLFATDKAEREKE